METMDDILSDKEPEKTEKIEKTDKTDKTEEAATETSESVSGAEVEKAVSRKRAHQAKEFAAQGRDPETGQYIAKEEKTEVKEESKEEKTEAKSEEKPEQKKEEFTEKERAFLRGLEEERRKRQDLERQLAEIKKPKEESEKKTFWDDPEGHLSKVQQEVKQVALQTKLQTSEAIARSRHTDFDEKVEAFAEILQQTPGLHAQWLSSADPAEFAYKLGRNHLELKQAGDLDKWRENIRKEERAKMEAEFKKKQEDLEKQRSELPSSLSDVKGASRKTVPVWNGPMPFEEILKS